MKKVRPKFKPGDLVYTFDTLTLDVIHTTVVYSNISLAPEHDPHNKHIIYKLAGLDVTLEQGMVYETHLLAVLGAIAYGKESRPVRNNINWKHNE